MAQESHWWARPPVPADLTGPPGATASPRSRFSCLHVAGIFAVGVVVGTFVQDAYQHVRGINQFSEASAQVKLMLMAQQDAWNKGDLKGFLAEYEMSKEITFFSDNETPPGWVALSDRFTNKYGSDRARMGRLEFSELDFTTFRKDVVMVRGRWTTSPEHTGLFTILVKKTDAGWKIVHDHTSERKAVK